MYASCCQVFPGFQFKVLLLHSLLFSVFLNFYSHLTILMIFHRWRREFTVVQKTWKWAWRLAGPLRYHNPASKSCIFSRHQGCDFSLACETGSTSAVILFFFLEKKPTTVVTFILFIAHERANLSLPRHPWRFVLSPERANRKALPISCPICLFLLCYRMNFEKMHHSSVSGNFA